MHINGFSWNSRANLFSEEEDDNDDKYEADDADDEDDGDADDDEDDVDNQWWKSVKEDRLPRPGPRADQVRPVAVGVLVPIQIHCRNTMHKQYKYTTNTKHKQCKYTRNTMHKQYKYTRNTNTL